MTVSQYVRDSNVAIESARGSWSATSEVCGIVELDYHYRQPHENSMGMSLM
jgi:hypothetical protein